MSALRVSRESGTTEKSPQASIPRFSLAALRCFRRSMSRGSRPGRRGLLAGVWLSVEDTGLRKLEGLRVVEVQDTGLFRPLRQERLYGETVYCCPLLENVITMKDFRSRTEIATFLHNTKHIEGNALLFSVPQASEHTEGGGARTSIQLQD